MARDPRQHMLRAASPDGRLEQRVADLEKAVAILQRTPTLGVLTTGGTSPPPVAAANGSAVAASTRLWVRVDGTWKYTTLT